MLTDAAIKPFVFEENNGVRVLKSLAQQSFGIARESRVYDFKARRMEEPCFVALAMERSCCHTRAGGHAHHNVGMFMPSVMEFRQIINDLIESTSDEICKLHFNHGLPALHGKA